MLKIRERRNAYMAAVAIFVVSLSGLYALGAVPYYVDGTSSNAKNEDRFAKLAAYGFSDRAVALSNVPELGGEQGRVSVSSRIVEPVSAPKRLVIKGVSIDLPVLNPESTDIGVLDEALTRGTVRYPTSARLGEDGNVFIFGHSSGLPVVRNQMYKALNGIESLESGDTISVFGNGREYLYRVTSVRLTEASEVLVDLSTSGGKRLTLSTCNSFGSKSERWVVEAEFVSSFVASS